MSTEQRLVAVEKIARMARRGSLTPAKAIDAYYCQQLEYRHTHAQNCVGRDAVKFTTWYEGLRRAGITRFENDVQERM